MTIRRASVILPCRGLDDFPTHLAGPGGGRPAGRVDRAVAPGPDSRDAGACPGGIRPRSCRIPATLEGELVVVPSSSRERMAPDWCDRLRATAPQNPPPVDAVAISQTIRLPLLLSAAAIDPGKVTAESVADFLALGYAHLQVELITRALRYTSVLDTDQFTSAVVAAAGAAVAGNQRNRTRRARAGVRLVGRRAESCLLGRLLRGRCHAAGGFDVGRIVAGKTGGRLANELAHHRRAN